MADDKKHCSTHGWVDAVEVHTYVDIDVHMRDVWHTAVDGRYIKMAGEEPALDGDGKPVVVDKPFDPPWDVAPEEDAEDGADDA